MSLHSTEKISKAGLLRSNVQCFCEALFGGSTPPAQMLDTYFTSDAKIHEHGQIWAAERLPFLGKTFHGRRATSDKTVHDCSCDEYFDLLGATLLFHPHENTLPPSEGYVVDADTDYRGGKPGSGAVMVKANSRLSAVKSGQSWEEDFVFVFSDFSADGKIGSWEIWADNLSAWTAVGEEKGCK